MLPAPPMTMALVLANSPALRTEPTPKRLAYVRALADRARWLLCCDGAAQAARLLGLAPTLIVGDLDSSSDTLLSYFSDVPVMIAGDQERTDLEKTLLVARGLGADSVAVLGALGGAFDHALANLSVLSKFAPDFAGRLSIWDDDSVLRPVLPGAPLCWELPPGATLSLIPLPRADGVTTEGLHWPLTDEPLEWAVRDGVRNRVDASPVRVSVRSGLLWAIADRADSDPA